MSPLTIKLALIHGRVEGIPGDDGFSKAGEVFHDAADRLLELGMTEDEIVDFLGGLYHATASEYGD